MFFFSSPAFSQSGYLYGTATFGGKYGYGVLFRYDIATGYDSILINFDGVTQGAYPLSNVILASNGLIYGNAYSGGVSGYGTIYSYNPLKGKDSIWKNFDSIHDGCYPIGGLIQSKSGLLYGAAVNGANGFGTIFSLNITTGQYKTVYGFDSIHGSFPWSPPLETRQGLLYGTTNSGGKYNDGVIYCFNPATGTDTTCLNFDDSAHGQNPDGSLCLANDSLLYGMTNSGGALGYGVLFGYNPKSGQCATVISFNDTDGAYAFSNVIQANDGKLYGMTEGGGIQEAGVILSYKPGSGADSVCVDLASPIGANPFGSVIQAPSGILYGTTYYGGSADSGVIFSYNTVLHTYTDLFDFSNKKASGYFPNASLLYVKDTTVGINELAGGKRQVAVYPNPNKGIFSIQLAGGNGQEAVEIYNMLGEKIYSNTFSTFNSQFSINLTGQPAGIYLYRVVSENGECVGSGKMVIEK